MTGTAPDSTPARPPRRERSATESLLSIVLVLEACMVFFAALAAFGLKVLEPATALLGGLALIVLLVLTGRVVRYPWGLALGWALQVGLIAAGILMPVMYFIGAGFAAIWTYCFIKGRQLDRAKITYREETP